MTGVRSNTTLVVFLAHVAVVFAAVAFRWKYDNFLAEYDPNTQFLPWFSLIGERLREFDIPAWNPHDSSGYPMIGAPATGWMYYPIMVAFTFFSDPMVGYKVFVLLTVLTGSTATWLFCRKLQLSNIASFAASVSFGIGPLLYGITMFNTPVSQAVAIVPVAMLAAEGALQASRRSALLGWSMLGAVAFTNLYAASVPRMMYGAFAVAVWLAFRWLVLKPDSGVSRKVVLQRAIVFGMASGIGFFFHVLSALWPQLTFQAESNVAGGDYSGLVGGDYVESLWSLTHISKTFLEGDNLSLRVYLQGTALLVTAVVGLFLGRYRGQALAFLTMLVLLCGMTWNGPLIRSFFELFPGFDQISSHRPSASIGTTIWVFAMLFGFGIQAIWDGARAAGRYSPLVTAAMKFFPLLFLVDRFNDIEAANYKLGNWQFALAFVATAVLFLPELVSLVRSSLWIPVARGSALALVLLSMVFPTGVDFARTLEEPRSRPTGWLNPIAQDDEVTRNLELITSSEPLDGPAQFITGVAETQQPFRYAAFTGTANPDAYAPAAARRNEYAIIATLANSRATFLNLEQISGYHPVHFDDYVDYFNAMNGAAQDYHYLDVMSGALDGSQLLDMLNVRFVLVPARLDPQPAISGTWPVAYQDNLVIIYENPNVFPRAWIVHNVLQAEGVDVLQELDSGAINGRFTAFVEGELPVVAQPESGPTASGATVTAQGPESLVIQANAGAAGLLVVSEVYASGWNAYVDGERVDILKTNHTLRGIPVPAGEHTVELKYEPRELQLGLLSTALSGFAFTGIWIWAGLDRRRSINAHGSDLRRVS